MQENPKRELNSKKNNNEIAQLKNKINQLKNSDIITYVKQKKIKECEAELYKLEFSNKIQNPIQKNNKINPKKQLNKELNALNDLHKNKQPNTNKKQIQKDSKLNIQKQFNKELSTLKIELKKITKSNELLKKEKINLKVQIDDLKSLNQKQADRIKDISNINLKNINYLKKNFKYFLYWNFLQSHYKLKQDDLLIPQKLETSKYKFFLALREFLSTYRANLHVRDNNFYIMKDVIEGVLKFNDNDQKKIIVVLNKIAHANDSFILKEKDKNFIKDFFTEENYLLFFPNTKEQKITFKEDHYEVLRSYYVNPSSSIALFSPIKKNINIKKNNFH